MDIVIIDDSPTTLAILRSVAAKFENVTVKGFTDPVEALEFIQDNPVRLVIADYSMPKMTGIEIVKKMRASQRHVYTPIAMVTASMEHAVQTRALEVGVSTFLKKPVDAIALKRCIHEHLIQKIVA